MILASIFAAGLAAALAADAESVDLAAARLLARAGGAEPSIAYVQRAAAEQVQPTPSWSRRARLAALVPRLSAEARLDDRRYRVVGLTGASEVDYVRHTPGTALSLRASWDLPDLVFAEPELRAAAQAQAAAKARAEAVERATRLYYERQRILLGLAAAPPADARGRAEEELRLRELAAELDLLTGGRWSGGLR